MNILFVTQNARAGHSYVSKAFADALKDNHNVHILTTLGVKEQYPFWKDYDPIHIDSPYMGLINKWDEVESILKEKEIDVVFFNEWYDFNFVNACRKHAKTVTYIDWFRKDQVPMFERFYDLTISCAEHTYEVFGYQKNARFVPWGVDLDLFKPQDGDKQLFFHNSGWGGINGRKGTRQAIRAYDAIRKKNDNATMFLHTQKPVFSNTTVGKIKRWRKKGLEVKMGTVEHPGLYHKGQVYVAPTKLEGLGLYIPEALASGMPVIATDAYPIKQFIVPNETGLLVKTKGEKQRPDGYAFPEYEIDQDDLEEKMQWCVDNPKEVKRMQKKARKFMEENHSFEQFKKKTLKIINELK